MLTQSFTHKSHKITTLTTATADSYKQLFVLITMLLTVLSLQQQPSTFAMAAPLETAQQQPQQQPQQYQLTQTQPSPHHNLAYNTYHHTQLHEILLAKKSLYNSYNHNNHNHHNYINHNHNHLLRQQQEQQLETDLLRSEQKGNDSGNEDGEEEERLHKRGISWHDYYNSIMQSQAINWYNPCGGVLKMVQQKRPPIKKELRKLQSSISRNYNTIKGTLRVINIHNMKQWDLIEKYSFLPKLNNNSTISLRRWHRQLQIYVAAFEYLRRAQLHFDYIKDSQESAYARELNELMRDARDILCYIEHAVNNTTTRKSALVVDSLFINRSRMEDILKFTTDIKQVSPLRWHLINSNDNKNFLVDPLDLKFTKSHYYTFIRKLIKTLRINTKRPGPIFLGKKAKEQKEAQGKQQQQLNQQKKKPQNQRNSAKIRHSRKQNSNKY